MIRYLKENPPAILVIFLVLFTCTGVLNFATQKEVVVAKTVVEGGKRGVAIRRFKGSIGLALDKTPDKFYVAYYMDRMLVDGPIRVRPATESEYHTYDVSEDMEAMPR